MDFIEIITDSANRIAKAEDLKNLQCINLRPDGAKRYTLRFYLKNMPSDEELEAMSLMHTEIVADVWGRVEELEYEWQLGQPQSNKIGQAPETLLFSQNAVY